MDSAANSQLPNCSTANLAEMVLMMLMMVTMLILMISTMLMLTIITMLMLTVLMKPILIHPADTDDRHHADAGDPY